MIDLYSNIGVVSAIDPADQAATIKGVAIDLTGFESVAFVVSTGAVTSAGAFSAKVQESDTTNDVDFSDADPAAVDSNAPATLAADAVYKLGYRGFKQFARVVLTKTGGTSLIAGAVAIKGHAHKRPVA